MTQIRPATDTDVEAMAGIWLRSALGAYAHIFPAEAPKPTVAHLADQIARVGGGLVACDDAGALTGIVQTDAADLCHLYVDPSCWGRGIGAALHDAAVAALRDAGATTAWLWVLRKNDRARAMYERRGWQLTTDVRWVYEAGGVDDVRYARDL